MVIYFSSVDAPACNPEAQTALFVMWTVNLAEVSRCLPALPLKHSHVIRRAEHKDAMWTQCDAHRRGLGAELAEASICTEKLPPPPPHPPADAGGSEGSARLNCAWGRCVPVQAGGATLQGAPAICHPAPLKPDSWFSEGVVMEATVLANTDCFCRLYVEGLKVSAYFA